VYLLSQRGCGPRCDAWNIRALIRVVEHYSKSYMAMVRSYTVHPPAAIVQHKWESAVLGEPPHTPQPPDAGFLSEAHAHSRPGEQTQQHIRHPSWCWLIASRARQGTSQQ
jgi:hypothetical protein